MEFYLFSFVFRWLCLVLVASKFQFCIGETCCINSFLTFFFILYKLKGKTQLGSDFFPEVGMAPRFSVYDSIVRLILVTAMIS